MPTRILGRTDMIVSRFGRGLAALGRPGYINIGHAGDLGAGRDVAAMEARAHAVLDEAWASGVRYIDAARSDGRAEEFLARWLAARRIDPAEVTIGSRWGYTYTAAWRVDADRHEIKDHSVANLRRQAVESRSLLGEHLNLYQIHSATLDTSVLEDPAMREGLARLKGEGLRIGLSLSGPRQAETLRRAVDVEVAGERLFDCVQATLNLLEPSAGLVLAGAHAIGMGVVVKEALANGRLTARNNDPAFAPERRVLADEAIRLGTTVDGVALAAVLARPWAEVVLSGAATGEQLRSNLAATAVAWDDEAVVRLGPLAEGPEGYWATRSGMRRRSASGIGRKSRAIAAFRSMNAAFGMPQLARLTGSDRA
jgi:aryl-alcohol dehydrogenase-like predicted oxidoreductase